MHWRILLETLGAVSIDDAETLGAGLLLAELDQPVEDPVDRPQRLVDQIEGQPDDPRDSARVPRGNGLRDDLRKHEHLLNLKG